MEHPPPNLKLLLGASLRKKKNLKKINLQQKTEHSKRGYLAQWLRWPHPTTECWRSVPNPTSDSSLMLTQALAVNSDRSSNRVLATHVTDLDCFQGLDPATAQTW